MDRDPLRRMLRWDGGCCSKCSQTSAVDENTVTFCPIVCSAARAKSGPTVTTSNPRLIAASRISHVSLFGKSAQFAHVSDDAQPV